MELRSLERIFLKANPNFVNFFKGKIGIFPSPASMKKPAILTGCR